ncbi:MAG: AsmA-like C-terminal region-containing protein, partial [candidate division Zixibacteria bacterium]
DVSFSGGLGVSLQNVAISDPAGWDAGHVMKAAEIDVKLQLWPLLSGEYRVDRMIINEPDISLRKKANGSTNFALKGIDTVKTGHPAIDTLMAATKAAAAAISFDRLEINNGKLVYVDELEQRRIELDQFDLKTSLENPRTAYFQSSGELRAARIAISAEEPWPVYSVDLEYEIGYDISRQSLTLTSGKVGINDLSLDISGTIDNLPEDPSAHLQVKTERSAVSGLFALLPPSQRQNLKDYDIAGDFSLTADIEYIATNVDAPLQYTGTAIIMDMTMSTDDVPGELELKRAMLDFKPDNLRISIDDGLFDGQPLRGNLVVNDFEQPHVSGELAGEADLAFARLFMPSEDKHELAGRTSFEINFSGMLDSPADFDFSGSMAVQNGHYNSNLIPEPVESFEFDIYFDRTLVNVKDFKGRFPSGQLSFSGRVNNLIGYMMAEDKQASGVVSPSIDGKLAGRLNLAMLNQFLPEKGSPSMSGSIKMNLQFSGNATDPSNFKPRGRITITDGAYTDSLLAEPITYLACGMRISPDTITIDSMMLRFESSDIALSGKLSQPFPYLLPFDGIDRSQLRRPMFNFALTSGRFDIDKLFPEAVPGAQSDDQTDMSLDSVSIVFVPDIDGQGTFSADTIIYSEMEMTSVTAKVTIRDRVIRCHDATANLYTGKLSGETTIDLNDFESPQYIGSFAADQIEADDFISRFAGKMGGHLFGKIDVTGTYNAHGWDSDAFLNSLTMTGRANMKEGRLITSGVIHSLFSQLAAHMGEEFAEEQPLKNLATDLIVKDGRISLDDLATKLGNVGDFSIGGWYGFDGSIGYTGSLLLSEEQSTKLLSQKGLAGGLAGLFSSSDANTRVRLPFKIDGTTDHPKATLDFASLTENAGKNILKDAGNALQNLFKKKKKP